MFTCKRCEIFVSDVAKCSMCDSHYDFPCAGINVVWWSKLSSTCKLSSSPVLSKLRHKINIMSISSTKHENYLKKISDIKFMKAELSGIKCYVDFLHDSVKELTITIPGIEQRIELLKNTKVR